MCGDKKILKGKPSSLLSFDLNFNILLCKSLRVTEYMAVKCHLYATFVKFQIVCWNADEMTGGIDWENEC